MLKIKPEQQKGILITAAIIFITLIIGGKIIYQPKQFQSYQLKAQIQKESQRNSLIKEIVSCQDDIKRYQGRFSPQPTTAWLEDKLRSLIESLNIELIEINPKAGQELSGLAQLTVEVRLKANYHQIGKLVSRLEKSPEFIQVRKIQIISASSEYWNKLNQDAGKTIMPSGRRLNTAEEPAGSNISQAELETILNRSQEAKVTLEVSTAYVQ